MSVFDPIELGEFERRTGVPAKELAWSEADRIVSPRQIVRVRNVMVMPSEYLAKLITSIPLAGDAHRRPYADCRIDRYRLDPRMSKIGQTFVENAKILALHGEFHAFFEGFDLPYGVAKKGAYLIAGETAEGERALAQYVPPIVEQIGNRHAVLDGIHRFSYTKGAGTTLEIIKITDPKVPFPCDLHKWSAIKAVDAKPPKAERFFNLKPELFRDLKFVGIDG